MRQSRSDIAGDRGRLQTYAYNFLQTITGVTTVGNGQEIPLTRFLVTRSTESSYHQFQLTVLSHAIVKPIC